jgi:hypothetical protein
VTNGERVEGEKRLEGGCRITPSSRRPGRVRFALGANAHLSRKVRGEDGVPGSGARLGDAGGVFGGGMGFFLGLRTEARRVRARRIGGIPILQCYGD